MERTDSRKEGSRPRFHRSILSRLSCRIGSGLGESTVRNMVQPSSFEPEIDKSRLEDLRKRLKRACEEAKSRPDPVAPFESDKERFGEFS